MNNATAKEILKAEMTEAEKCNRFEVVEALEMAINALNAREDEEMWDTIEIAINVAYDMPATERWNSCRTATKENLEFKYEELLHYGAKKGNYLKDTYDLAVEFLDGIEGDKANNASQ